MKEADVNTIENGSAIRPAHPVPIFILGMMPRSGTHFLANLLCLHPACSKSVIPEDALVAKAHFLTRFAHVLHRGWLEQTGPESLPGKEMLLESLGDGLISFLYRAKQKALEANAKRNLSFSPELIATRLVTKSPTVENLDKFHTLFPGAQPLILVRDGRAVVESCARSFSLDREETTRMWVNAARRIRRFQEERDEGNYLIIRYEDLHLNTEREMKRILTFLRLDTDSYDFTAALNVPVVGSSTFKRGEGPVHWWPVKKTDEFDPLTYADGWTRGQHERFNWLAAEYLQYFGYEPGAFPRNSLWALPWNKALDVKWSVVTRYRKFRKLLESSHRA